MRIPFEAGGLRAAPGPALALALALSLAACASAPAVRPDVLARERQEAIVKSHADDAIFVLRLNPSTCDCPPIEVLLDGVWQRAFLEPADEAGPAEQVRRELTDASVRGEVGATARVTGRLKGVRPAPNRAPCLVFRVISACGPQGCGAK